MTTGRFIDAMERGKSWLDFAREAMVVANRNCDTKDLDGEFRNLKLAVQALGLAIEAAGDAQNMATHAMDRTAGWDLVVKTTKFRRGVNRRLRNLTMPEELEDAIYGGDSSDIGG